MFRRLFSTVLKSRRNHRRRRAYTQQNIEALEIRTLLSAISLGGDGVLTIQGTAANETVDVWTSNSGTVLNVRDYVETTENFYLQYNTADVIRIEVFSGDGNDVFDANGLSIPVFVDGGAGDDEITGSDKADVLLGGSGNDILLGRYGDDELHGGDGNDWIEGGAGHDVLFGDNGDDRLYGDIKSGNIGPAGNDELHGGDGADILWGSKGNDILFGDAGNDNLRGHAGDDILRGGGGVDTLNGGAGFDTMITVNGGLTTLTNNQLIVGGITESLFGIEYADVSGGSGNDTFDVSGWTGTGVINGLGGTDLVVKSADIDFSLSDTLLSTTDGMSVMLAGIEQADLTGGSSDNEFDVSGWTGGGTLDGSGGTDTLIATGNLDFILSNTQLTSSAGMSMMHVAIEEATLTGGNSDNVINAIGFVGRTTQYGRAGNDSLFGALGDDLIFGGDGDDTIVGGIGNDSLHGDAGKDTLYGTGGDDFLSGGSNADNLFGGSGDDTLHGNDGNDFLFGEQGIDLLFGLTGNDELHGGDGDDILQGGQGDDKLFGNAGNDLLFGEKLLFPGNTTGNDELYGGDGDDVLAGGNGNDLLYGEAGNDLLGGEAGNDTLEGGTGNDVLYGGDGNDVLLGNNDDDTLYGEAGDDRLVGGKGVDELFGGTGFDVDYLMSDLANGDALAVALLDDGKTFEIVGEDGKFELVSGSTWTVENTASNWKFRPDSNVNFKTAGSPWQLQDWIQLNVKRESSDSMNSVEGFAAKTIGFGLDTAELGLDEYLDAANKTYAAGVAAYDFVTELSFINGPELFTIRSGSQVEQVNGEVPSGFLIDGQPYVYTFLGANFELGYGSFSKEVGAGITMILDPTEPFAYFDLNVPKLAGVKLAYSHDGHLTYTPLQQPDLWEKSSFTGHVFAEVSGISIAGFLKGTGSLMVDLDANDDGNKIDFSPSDLLNFKYLDSPVALLTSGDVDLSDLGLGFNGSAKLNMKKLGGGKLSSAMSFTVGQASVVFDGEQQGFFFHGSGSNPFRNSLLEKVAIIGPDFKFNFDGAMTGVSTVGQFNVPTNYRLTANGKYSQDGVKNNARILMSSHSGEPWLAINGKMKVAGMTANFAGTVARNGDVDIMANQRISGREKIGIKGVNIKVKTVSDFTFRFSGNADTGITLGMDQYVSLSANKKVKGVGRFKISGEFQLTLNLSLDGKFGGWSSVDAFGEIKVETPFGNDKISGTIKAEISDSGLRVKFPFLGIGWQKLLEW